MRNTSLVAITEEKDLDVTIDLNLKFHMHMSKAANKASRILGFTCIDEMTLPRLFTTMVRPHLEYGVQCSDVTSWNSKNPEENPKPDTELERSAKYR